MNNLLRTSTLAMIAAFAASGGVAQPVNSSELSDPRVRQAIAYAIDMETIAETLFEGAAIPAIGMTSDPNNYPETMNSYSYDPDRARALLAEAGWDGSRTLDMVYYYPDQLTADFMAVVQAQLADVGISMNYRLLEGDVGAQITVMPDDPVEGPSGVQWDMLYGARAAIANQEYFNRFAEGQMPMIPTVEAMLPLVEQVNGTVDPAVQRAGYQQMEGIINENVYILPLYYQQLYVFESDRINRNGAPYGNEQYNYKSDVINWTVEPNENGERVAYTNAAPMQFFELPWQNLGIWIHSRFAFDTILEADGSLTAIGGELAESYDVSDDGLTFSFTLREGLKWHDGTDLTAEDVRWSIETAALAPIVQPLLSTTLGRIEGAEAFKNGEADSISGVVVDGRTVTLSFATIDPNMLMSFAQFAPLPSAYFEGVDPLQIQQHEFWQNPVGSGPFMIEEARMNEFTTLVPFPDYHKGVAQIERIIALPSADGDANLIRNAAAFRADFGYTKNATDVPALEEMEHMNVIAVNIPYTRMFWINQFPRE